MPDDRSCDGKSDSKALILHRWSSRHEQLRVSYRDHQFEVKLKFTCKLLVSIRASPYSTNGVFLKRSNHDSSWIFIYPPACGGKIFVGGIGQAQRCGSCPH